MITVYGRSTCGICNSAKEKFLRMGKEFDAKEIDYAVTPHEGWRTDGSVDAQAAYALFSGHLPVIKMDGEWFNYPGAMKALKEKKA